MILAIIGQQEKRGGRTQKKVEMLPPQNPKWIIRKEQVINSKEKRGFILV
jgi:hypothetical protein